ncbi:hypothetical protein PRIC1_013490 [Phytophthora ramorum]|nr:hypothetical protein KRP22_9863 [Phytophthora ramorum]
MEVVADPSENVAVEVAEFSVATLVLPSVRTVVEPSDPVDEVVVVVVDLSSDEAVAVAAPFAERDVVALVVAEFAAPEYVVALVADPIEELALVSVVLVIAELAPVVEEAVAVAEVAPPSAPFVVVVLTKLPPVAVVVPVVLPVLVSNLGEAEFPSVVVVVLVLVVEEEAPSIVAPNNAAVVLVDTEEPAAFKIPVVVLSVVFTTPDDPLEVVTQVVELLADPFMSVSDLVVVVTVVIPVTASLVVEVLVVFTPLSEVTVVTGDDPFSASVVVIVVVETLPAFPSVAVLRSLVAPLEAGVLVVDDLVLLLAFDVLVLTVVVVTVVINSPDEVVSFLVVTDLDLTDGAVVAAKVVIVPVDAVLSVADVRAEVVVVLVPVELPVSITEEVDWKSRSDTISTDCGARRIRAG